MCRFTPYQLHLQAKIATGKEGLSGHGQYPIASSLLRGILTRPKHSPGYGPSGNSSVLVLLALIWHLSGSPMATLLHAAQNEEFEGDGSIAQ